MADSGEGLLLLNKPVGITSFQALRQIKSRLGTGKVGHAGTLDPFAGGLLLVLAGRMTRLLSLFVTLDKTYEAVIRFGEETDTLDPEGRTVASGPVPSWEAIEAALPVFLGAIDQVPPAFSAIHSGGERAHRIARAGGLPVLAPRRVVVHELQALGWDAPLLKLRIRCSKGTYVRSLARDLGLRCGSRAHVSELQRTRIGDFRLEEAVDASDFNPARDLVPPSLFLGRLEGVDRVVVPDELLPAVLQGVPLPRQALLTPVDGVEGPDTLRLLALFTRDDRLVALALSGERLVRYQAVLGGAGP